MTRGSEVLIDAASVLADDAANIAGTASTRFQISSVSRQFVAAAVLLRVQDGALSLEDSITRFFPEAPPAWGAITLHHLLTHTAGLGHWPDLPGFDIDDPPKADDLLRVLFTGPVLHQLRNPPQR